MRYAWAAVAATATVCAVAACGSSDSGSPSAEVTTRSGSGNSGSLTGLYKGTYGRPPTTSPKPEPGKDFWFISCGQAVDSCSVTAAAAVKAARSVGWKVHVVDGKLNPEQIGAGIRQAVSAGADVIGTFALDCANAKGPLTDAKKAKVPVIAAEVLDCTPPLYSAIVSYQDGDFETWERKFGGLGASWLIAKSGGAAKVINFNDQESATTKLLDDGFKTEMAKCPGCKIVADVKFTSAEIGPALQQKAAQALLQHPEATAVRFPFDPVGTLGVLPAVQSSGRAKRLLVVGGEGFQANLDLLRSGRGQDAGTGGPNAWEGWAIVDAANRVLHGQNAVPSGIGLQLYDREHNVPATGAYEPPVDFETAYLKAWGVQ